MVLDYFCEECGFAALLNHQSQTHIKQIHSKLKDHRCKQCGYPLSLKTIHVNDFDIYDLRVS